MALVNGQQRIGAVIAAYHPDESQLRMLWDRLSRQVSRVVVVNNGAPGDLPALPERLGGCAFAIIENNTNRGVAAAFNQGWRWLEKEQVERVLFLDQDSVPAEDMVAKLADVLDAHWGSKMLLAAVGAQIQDAETDRLIPFVRFGRIRGRHAATCRPEPVEADFLISSGMMASIQTLRQSGAFEERLFIDSVDLEWSFRMRSRGYKLLGVPRAQMRHHIGKRRYVFGIIPIRWHASGRLYFMMRNRVVLYGRKYTPISWIISDLAHAAAKFALFSLIISPRIRNCRLMLKGVWDGLRKRYDLSPELI